MKTSTNTANVSLELLNSEAISLLDQAKKYRAEMDRLPENDPSRKIYDQMIRDLLDRSRKLSFTVTTSASGT